MYRIAITAFAPTVHGASISFGTLGSLAVTYPAAVSGATMAGSYKVAGSSRGPRSAARK